MTLNEEAITWEEFESEKGKKYQVGYLEKNEVNGEDPEKKLMDKKNFGIAVSWPVTINSDWILTSGDVKSRAAITQYALYKYNGSTYDYKLYFTNTEHYNYLFYDETGDSYRVNTYRNGDHFVRYNSEEPKIVYIKGS
jgi:hypothetical protein